MKTSVILAAFFISFQSIAGIVPRINCIGSSYDKKVLKVEEIQEEKVLLEYRSGGAAFSNVFFGDLTESNFIVVLNKAFPISNIEAVPLTLGIYNAKTYKAYAEKNVVLLANGITVKIEAKSDDHKILTLVCTRLLNPML